MALRVEIDERPRLPRYEAVAHLAGAVHELEREAVSLLAPLRKRTVWMLSSTAKGGGVAEMLPGLITFLRDLGLRCEWLVIEPTEAGFFNITKTLHNMLHGTPGRLDAEASATYEAVSRDNAQAIAPWILPGDIVVAHDPQPLGTAVKLGSLRDVKVVFRSHIGLGEPMPSVDDGWDFLRPYLLGVHRAVFSAAEYIPHSLMGRASIIHPALDPVGHKNREISLHKLVGVLCNGGLMHPHNEILHPPFEHQACRLAPNGKFEKLKATNDIGLLTRPIVTQVSRWDRLKGFAPLIDAFRLLKEKRLPAASTPLQKRRLTLTRLVLAGPEPTGVTDDPESHEVLSELRSRYLALPKSLQSDVALVTLPMASRRINALMVNALQRSSTIVVQNSIREGFGLTIAEAMFKRVPVLGNTKAVGIRTQLRDGLDGRLIHDPENIEELSLVLDEMLSDSKQRDAYGAAGQRRAHDEFLIFKQARLWLQLFGEL